MIRNSATNCMDLKARENALQLAGISGALQMFLKHGNTDKLSRLRTLEKRSRNLLHGVS